MGAEAVVWPLTRDLTTASFHPDADHRAACAARSPPASGVHIHRGDALPEGHRGSVFISESAQNLVQRQVREPDGVSFRSHPAREGVEFLASRDTWFRPVFAANGPDGALYIVDMYRKDIDHPAYVPEASRRLFDFTAGRGLRTHLPSGRAGSPARSNRRRSRRHGHRSARAQPRASQRVVAGHGAAAAGRAPAAELPHRSCGSWPRRGGESGRLQALWTLDGLGVLNDEDVVRAMRDQSASVRRTACAWRRPVFHASPGLTGCRCC